MTTTPRVLAAATIGLTLTGLLAGCGDGAAADVPLASASPVLPTASPSPGADDTSQQHGVDDATDVLVEYYAEDSKVANEGYEGADVLRAFWSDPDAWASMRSAYAQAKKLGYRTEGSTRVAVTDVVDYVDDPTGSGFEKVSLAVCVDSSGVTTYDDDGSEVPRGERPARFEARYALQHQGEDSRWTITGFEPSETSC